MSSFRIVRYQAEQARGGVVPQYPIPVAIVAAGRANCSLEGYQGLARTWAAILNRKTIGSEKEKRFDARTFETVEGAMEFLTSHGYMGSLVFLSEVHTNMAQRVAANYLQIRVLIFTGILPPVGRPVIIQKSWVNASNLGTMVSPMS